MNSRRQLITPHTRGQITRALHDSGKWTGTRLGYRLRLRLEQQPTLDNERVSFTVYELSSKEIAAGHALTVFDAVTSIQAIVDRRRLHNPTNP